MTTTTAPTRLPTTKATPTDEWQEQAACREVDPDLFFPVAHTYGWRKQTAAAKKVCSRCPVQPACLEWALETGQRAGVWGGLAEGERLSLSRERQSSTQVCLDQQVWIERQLAKNRSQKSIARELGVDSAALSRVVRQFEQERATVLAMEMKGAKTV